MKTARPLVIFDLDGTLVDSRHDIAAALNISLVGIGCPPRPEEELFGQIGRPLLDIYLEIGIPGDRDAAGRAMAIYRERFHDHCADRSRLYAGVAETLRELRRDFHLAVATTKQGRMAERVTDQLGLRSFFDHIQGTDGFAAKPDPTIVRLLLERFGVPADRAAMVGDTAADVRAGKQAGVFTIAVTYGIGSEQELRAAGADAVAGDFPSLAGLVRQALPVQPA